METTRVKRGKENIIRQQKKPRVQFECFSEEIPFNLSKSLSTTIPSRRKTIEKSSTPRYLSTPKKLSLPDSCSVISEELEIDNHLTPVVTRHEKGSNNFNILNSVDGENSFNNERPRTEIGPQGAHVSAYTLYEELVYSAIIGKPIRGNLVTDILNKFKFIFPNCVEDEKLKEKVEEIEKEMQKKDISFSIQDREDVKSVLESGNRMDPFKDKASEIFGAIGNLSEEKRNEILKMIGIKNTEKFKDTKIFSETAEGLKGIKTTKSVEVELLIRDGKRSRISKLVSEVVNIILSSANKMPYVSVPHEGNIERKEKGVEKKAKDYLLSLEKNFNKKKNDLDRISEKIEHLFWYPRIPKMLNVNSKKWKNNADKYNKSTKPRDNNLDILHFVLARHIILMFNCFKVLQDIPKKDKIKITNKFLENILKNQEWEKEAGVNKESLKNGIEKYAKLDYNKSEFYMVSNGSEIETPDLPKPNPRKKLSNLFAQE